MGTNLEAFEKSNRKPDDLVATQSQDKISIRSAGRQIPIRVLVANRTAIESELLADSIGKDRRFVAVGWGVRYADIDSLAFNRHPDVLLITPKLDEQANAGFDVLADFRISYPGVKTVVLLESHNAEFVVQAFRLGARGVFSKDFPLKLLTKCITRVYEGQIWATNEQFGFVLEALAVARNGHPCRNDPSKLSAGELEVVSSLAEGLASENIARGLKLRKHKRKNKTGRISHKLGDSGCFEPFSPRQQPSLGSSPEWRNEPGDRRVA